MLNFLDANCQAGSVEGLQKPQIGRVLAGSWEKEDAEKADIEKQG